MLDRSTSIQNLFETLIREKKKVILFGAGERLRFYVKKINRYIWYLCDDWKTPSYISDEPEYSYIYSGLEAFIDCIIDNDEKKQNQYITLNDGVGRFKVRSAEYLKEINPKKYIIIIVTDKYEKEVKEQLQIIENIKGVPCYSYNSNMHYYEGYSRGLIVDRMIIPYMMAMEAMAPYEFPYDEYDRIKTLIEQGECVCNGVSFQITTICNLKCRYCADYVPRLPENRNMDLNRVLEDIEAFFSVVGRCLYIQLATGEAVLCSNLDIILEKLLPMDDVRLINIVTNGLAYPKDEKVLKLLANPKVLITMSNYNMPEKTDLSRKFYKDHNINVRFLEGQKYWFKQGTKPYKRNLDHETLRNYYVRCTYVRSCPPWQFTEGKLTGCGRIQSFAELSDCDSSHDYIDFTKYEDKEELKRAIIKFSLEPYMDGCAWCDAPYIKPSDIVKPGEQLEVGEQ